MRERGKASLGGTRLADLQAKVGRNLSLACASGWCESSGDNMKLTTPFNIGVTGETTVELSMANGDEARALAKLFERNGIVCTISDHWLQAEGPWEAVLDVLRGGKPSAREAGPSSESE
jgi:hypothetical protein